jgi:hypothetical protein
VAGRGDQARAAQSRDWLADAVAERFGSHGLARAGGLLDLPRPAGRPEPRRLRLPPLHPRAHRPRRRPHARPHQAGFCKQSRNHPDTFISQPAHSTLLTVNTELATPCESFANTTCAHDSCAQDR